MEYRIFNNKYVIRFDRGEEIVSELTKLCEKEGIKLGTVSAIGAVDRLTIGLFNCSIKQYYKESLDDDFEIASLTGNISTMQGETYLHLHITVTDGEFNARGGHLSEAWVSGTCEMIVDAIDGELDREFSHEIGLNLYKF